MKYLILSTQVKVPITSSLKCKINIRKFVVFLYTNIEITERESKKKFFFFKITSKIPRSGLPWWCSG